MAGELGALVQNNSYCKCKSYCKADSKIAVPRNIDYVIITFGKTSVEDTILHGAKSGDIKSILENADEKEICYKFNRSAIPGVFNDLSGEFHLVTTKDNSQERGKTNGNYFHFHGLSSDRLLRIPLYDENGEQFSVNEFIDIFKENITKYYDSLVCETVSGIAGTSCSLIESYVKTLLEGRDQERAIDNDGNRIFIEDGLFNDRLGFAWRDNIVDCTVNNLNDAEENFVDLETVKLLNNKIRSEAEDVGKSYKSAKGKPDQSLIDRSNKLVKNRETLELYKNNIIAYLQHNLISSYRGHPDIDDLISKKASAMDSIDSAKQYFDTEEYLREKHVRCPTNLKNSEAKSKPLELFLHLYQLASMERLKRAGDFSICTRACDVDGGKEHHKIHANNGEAKVKVLVTNLRAEDPDHLQMYMEEYRKLGINTLVLFRSPW